jgi:hypothetical protein
MKDPLVQAGNKNRTMVRPPRALQSRTDVRTSQNMIAEQIHKDPVLGILLDSFLTVWLQSGVVQK